MGQWLGIRNVATHGVNASVFPSWSPALLTDQHVKYADTPGNRPMRDLYYTLLNKTFGLNVPSFGTHTANIPSSYLTEILKA
ncbi:MAG TPA: hypothetical protein VHW01_14630 [Polyangiaceae bacterium]|nr:hypothetical protein [Polyangiaceae bacterium]